MYNPSSNVVPLVIKVYILYLPFGHYYYHHKLFSCYSKVKISAIPVDVVSS